MGTMDRIKNEAEDLAGKAKETVGKIVGDDEKVAEGRKDQASAGVKNAGEDVKDAASNAKDAAKDALGPPAIRNGSSGVRPARDITVPITLRGSLSWPCGWFCWLLRSSQPSSDSGRRRSGCSSSRSSCSSWAPSAR